MSLEPRETDEIYDSLQGRLQDETTKVTNFEDGSFNDRFLQAYAERIRELEIRAVAAELAGYVEYAGRDLTEDDLEALGITTVEPDEINPFMDTEQLDNLAANYGVQRDPGVNATGTVTFQVDNDTVQIEEGFEVSTEPDISGERLSFFCDVNDTGAIEADSPATVTPDNGKTSVDVTVIADDVGPEYNVGPGTIEYIAASQPGVTAVTNTASITGGANEQDNESLREDIQNAIFESSTGGTRAGIVEYIEAVAESDVRSVTVVDDPTYRPAPYSDVIVDGGDASEAQQLLDESKPAGVEHNFRRPTTAKLTAKVHVIGDVSIIGTVKQTVYDYIESLSVGERFHRSESVVNALNSYNTIVAVPAISVFIDRVENDRYLMDSTKDIYRLDYPEFGRISEEQLFHYDDYVTEDNPRFKLQYPEPETSSGSYDVDIEFKDVSQEWNTVSGTVTDADGDGTHESVVLPDINGGLPVMEGTNVRVQYDSQAPSVDAEIVDEAGTTYSKNGDFAVIDDDGDGYVDSIEWVGDAPDDGVEFSVSYNPYTTFFPEGDLQPRSDEKVDIEHVDDVVVEVFDEALAQESDPLGNGTIPEV